METIYEKEGNSAGKETELGAIKNAICTNLAGHADRLDLVQIRNLLQNLFLVPNGDLRQSLSNPTPRQTKLSLDFMGKRRVNVITVLDSFENSRPYP